jgi:hypothetical protein
MTITRSAAAVCLALACVAAVPAHAQHPTLRLGQTVQGRIARGDPAFYESGRFKVYQFRGQPGVRYVATLASADFDAFLTLARTVGGVTDYMVTNDDGGTDTNARLRFQVPAAGTYLLIAQSLAEEGTGAFTIALDSARVRRASIRDARVGETVRGELTDDDADYADVTDGTIEDAVSGYYDLYRIQAREGQRLRMRMTMEEFFTDVAVGTMENGQFRILEEPMASVDTMPITQSAGESVVFRVPEDGEYYVRAGAFGDVTGEYTLRIEDRTNTPAPRTTPIRRGQTITGALASGDPELDDGRLHDPYAYTGRAGERIRIAVASDDFDTVVILGRMVDGEFQELDRNDDGEEGGGTDSELEVELPDDGRYVIQVTSFALDSEGDYRLTVGAR